MLFKMEDASLAFRDFDKRIAGFLIQGPISLATSCPLTSPSEFQRSAVFVFPYAYFCKYAEMPAKNTCSVRYSCIARKTMDPLTELIEPNMSLGFDVGGSTAWLFR